MKPKLSIGIPGSGPPSAGTPFATTPIPVVVFDDWEQLPIRSPMSFKTVPRYSQYGTPQIEGPNYNTKYVWSATCKVGDNIARQLEALYEYQQRQQVPLRLWDESQYLNSEPAPHSRPLIEAFDEGWNAAYEYGYGQFEVWLALSRSWREHLATKVDGEDLVQITFSMVEL